MSEKIVHFLDVYSMHHNETFEVQSMILCWRGMQRPVNVNTLATSEEADVTCEACKFVLADQLKKLNTWTRNEVKTLRTRADAFEIQFGRKGRGLAEDLREAAHKINRYRERMNWDTTGS